MSGTLYYVHDGSMALKDMFTLRVSDGRQDSIVAISVVAQFSDVDAPMRDPTASMKLSINEGQYDNHLLITEQCVAKGGGVSAWWYDWLRSNTKCWLFAM